MKKQEKIFWDLFKANSEEEVDQIIKNNPVLNNPDNWTPYGGNKGNFGTFESQQNSPVPALVEKITNSIDATLIKDCIIHGIEPKSSEAPKTMNEAVEKFYGIKDGEIGKLSASKRRELAENIQILAVGDKKNPSLVIYDNGEGQHPENFQNTFLSLHNNNKINIQFVQGKYNMGSTGAVIFCGDKKFQLIASKRNTQISEKEGNMGFTLVRRHELNAEEELDYGKATWYEYFAPSGEIASFEIGEIDLGLYERNFISGTIIKLYSYQLPKGSRSNITLDLWRDLNQYMYHLPLPISLYEKRDYNSKTPSKLVLGNKTRITIDSQENVKNIISFHIPKESGLGEIDVDVIIFDPKVEHNEFIKNKSIIFTQNGQVHGYEGQSFISHELGFSLLKKNTLIHVDCTSIPTSIRQDLFMANRTHLKNGNRSEELRTEIIKLLRSSEELKRINLELRDSLLHNSESDQGLIESILSKMPADKDVINLLKKDGALNFLSQSGATPQRDGNNESKKLNRHPSLFKLDLKEEEKGKIFKTIPINSQGVIKIETDAENDYLFRPHDAGKMEINVLKKVEDEDDEPLVDDSNPVVRAKKISDILTITREGPVNGEIKLVIKPNENARVGDEVEVIATLTDENGTTFECMFDVKVDAEISKPIKKEKASHESFPALPTPKKAYKHPENEDMLAWDSPELNWTGHDIVKVITAKDEKNELMVEGIIVNMDSFVLKSFFDKNKIANEEEIKYQKDKYFLSIYLHALFQFSILQKMRQNDENLKDVEVDEFVSSMIKSYASFLMYENFHITKMAFND